ncbi:hypothetical protein GKZ87_09405 [Erysipelotrichaceae bacterium 66202529]|nr:hypothetical protein GKZ87_09405 [Erysipelotrichaceae bacterium 66202529]
MKKHTGCVHPYIAMLQIYFSN